MGSIAITLNGRKRNFNVGYIDWTEATRINTEYGTTPIENDNLQEVFDCISQRTVNPDALPDQSANAKWYIFRTTHVTPSLLKDISPISEQMGGAVLYYGATQETGDNLMSFFPQDTEWTMPPRNTAVDIKTENRHFVIDSNNTPCPLYWVSATEESKTPHVNWNSIGYFQTENGGSFGASLCVNEAAGLSQKASSVIIHSFGDYRYMDHSSADRRRRGNYWFKSISNTDHAYYPKFSSTEMFLGTPNNDNCLNSTSVSSTRWAMNAGAEDMFITVDVSAEFFSTIIDDERYVGLAACKWDGDYITSIEVCLLPSWYWGAVDYTIPEDLPDADEIWYGPEVTPQPGIGSHTITQGGTVDSSVPFRTIFDTLGFVGGGVHLYRINAAAYVDAMNYFWKYATDEILQTVISSVIACHQIPDELIPEKSARVLNLCLGPYGIPLAADSVSRAWSMQRFEKKSSFAHFGADDSNKSLARFTGCYLDFEPFTTVSLYLPFAGSVEIPASQCIGGSIDVSILVDGMNGDICYEIKASSDRSILCDSKGRSLVNRYYATGNCALEIPVTGITTGERQKISALSEKIGGMTQMAAGAIQIASGNIIGGASNVAAGGSQFMMGQYNSQPQHIAHQTINAGGISGSLSAIGSKQITLSVTRPAEAYDDFWVSLNGSTANIKTKISKIASPKSDNIFSIDSSNKITFDDATAVEKERIHELLVGGVYV